MMDTVLPVFNLCVLLMRMCHHGRMKGELPRDWKAGKDSDGSLTKEAWEGEDWTAGRPWWQKEDQGGRKERLLKHNGFDSVL